MGNKLKFEKLIVDIQVYDLNRAVRFYRDILGLQMVHKAGDWASFKVNDSEIHLYLHGGITGGLEFLVTDVDEEVRTLKSKGVKFFVDQNQYGLRGVIDEIMEFPWGKMALFKDSEGNQLALVQEKV